MAAEYLSILFDKIVLQCVSRGRNVLDSAEFHIRKYSYKNILSSFYSSILFKKREKKVKLSLTSADKHLLREFKLAVENFFALTYHFEVNTDGTVYWLKKHGTTCIKIDSL